MKKATPKLIRGPQIEARSRFFDSARWNDYRPRQDDVIIATYPKCGTTWTQRIVGMLIFQSDAPFAVQDSSPWPDMRIIPAGAAVELAESQSHRRFLKSHLPYDALPLYEGVKVIHVARDGRDAAMSFHHHKINYTPEIMERMSQLNVEDPRFGTPYWKTDPDPAVHFHAWLTDGNEDHLGDPTCGFWYLENSYWKERSDPDLLLLHYADLKKDLDGEMRRIAAFLDIPIDESLWPKLVDAARFESMKNKAAELMPNAGQIWQGGGNTFLNKGVNGRWRGVLDPADLALYDERVKQEFSPELARWLEFGRLGP
ncbi:MAG: sulfotransferase domain-containing protein [Pseudohongiellaceae bacterium]